MPSWVIEKIQSPLDNGGVSDGNQKDLVAIRHMFTIDRHPMVGVC